MSVSSSATIDRWYGELTIAAVGSWKRPRVSYMSRPWRSSTPSQLEKRRRSTFHWKTLGCWIALLSFQAYGSVVSLWMQNVNQFNSDIQYTHILLLIKIFPHFVIKSLQMILPASRFSREKSTLSFGRATNQIRPTIVLIKQNNCEKRKKLFFCSSNIWL